MKPNQQIFDELVELERDPVKNAKLIREIKIEIERGGYYRPSAPATEEDYRSNNDLQWRGNANRNRE